MPISKQLSQETHREFGTTLFDFAFFSYAYRFPKDGLEISEYEHLVIKHLINVGIYNDYGAIKKWFKGEIKNVSKPLSEFTFQRCVENWAGTIPALMTQVDLQTWAELGRPEYGAYLKSKTFKAFCLTKNIPEAPLSTYWLERAHKLNPYTDLPPLPINFINRQSLQDEILKTTIHEARNRFLPVLLYGEAGVGKTVLLRWLGRHPDLIQQYQDGVVWLEGSPQTTFNDWLKMLQMKILPSSTYVLETLDLMKTHLHVQLAKQNLLFLIDNCWNLEFVDFLSTMLSRKSFAIVTTQEASELHKKIVNIKRHKIPSFETKEILSYYLLNYEEYPDEDIRNYLNTLGAYVRNNPLAIRLALRAAQNYGWQSVLEFFETIKDTDKSEDGTALLNMLKFVYENLSPELQKAFRAFGALPNLNTHATEIFAPLWDISSEQANLLLQTLQKQADFFDQLPGNDDPLMEIVFHAQVYSYAKQLLNLAQFYEERNFAKLWEIRAFQTPYYQSYVQRFQDYLKDIGSWKKWTYTFYEVKSRRWSATKRNTYLSTKGLILPGELPLLQSREYLLIKDLLKRNTEESPWLPKQWLLRTLDLLIIVGSLGYILLADVSSKQKFLVILLALGAYVVLTGFYLLYNLSQAGLQWNALGAWIGNRLYKQSKQGNQSVFTKLKAILSNLFKL